MPPYEPVRWLAITYLSGWGAFGTIRFVVVISNMGVLSI